MQRFCLFASLALTLLAPRSAAGGNFSWDYQPTGFRSTASGPVQTAVSMRGHGTWPVVYGIDQSSLNAYSLFPVPNPNPTPIPPSTSAPRYWHQIGTNLTQAPVATPVYLQAASGEPDSFGISMQPQNLSRGVSDIVVLGDSQSGIQAPIVGAQALKFNDAGVAFTPDDFVPPDFPFDHRIFDVALSSLSDIGAITQRSYGDGALTYWQKSTLLGSAWLPYELVTGFSTNTLFGPSVDLEFDAQSRPHVVGVNRAYSANSVVAYRFDVISGGWKSATLDTVVTGQAISDAAMAISDAGIVGAAWVNNGTLKYGVLDTNEILPQWTVHNVTSLTPTGQPLELSQGVGLAFDRSGLPVISFVEQGNRQIWVAYDPPSSTPGDFNDDGEIDGADLAAWTTAFAAGSSGADADGDADSDGADFLAWQRHLGFSAPTLSTSTAVPEPAGAATMVLAALLLPIARRQSTPAH